MISQKGANIIRALFLLNLFPFNQFLIFLLMLDFYDSIYISIIESSLKSDNF